MLKNLISRQIPLSRFQLQHRRIFNLFKNKNQENRQVQAEDQIDVNQGEYNFIKNASRDETALK